MTTKSMLMMVRRRKDLITIMHNSILYNRPISFELLSELNMLAVLLRIQANVIAGEKQH